MRGMGITIQGEDYVNFAEHKGLSGVTIFRDYYMRNALLPQVTGFALALGSLITSGLIVEGTFSACRASAQCSTMRSGQTTSW